MDGKAESIGRRTKPANKHREEYRKGTTSKSSSSSARKRVVDAYQQSKKREKEKDQRSQMQAIGSICKGGGREKREKEKPTNHTKRRKEEVVNTRERGIRQVFIFIDKSRKKQTKQQSQNILAFDTRTHKFFFDDFCWVAIGCVCSH